jgi:hypothetical protein
MSDEEPSHPPLDVLPYLWGALDSYDSDLVSEYAPSENSEQKKIEEELNAFASRVSEVLYDPDPEKLRFIMADIPAAEPFEHGQRRLLNILGYRYIQEEAEGAVARKVVDRLDGVRERIRKAFVATYLLYETAAPPTAVKYLRQVLDLFLAGYTTEVIVMCGAVLEAAMRDRIPDAELRYRGIKPAFKTANDYSLGQRMKVEPDLGVFTEQERELFWKVVNGRNDAVHVQPDIGPEPVLTLWLTAALLGKIRPVSDEETGSDGPAA